MADPKTATAPARPQIRKPYDPAVPSRVDFSDTLHLAKQSFTKDADINNIVGKFQRGQVIDYLNQNEPTYGELPGSADYLENMLIVVAAQEHFEGLPSLLRNKFDNDPAKYLAFVENPDNLDEMVDLGLATRPVTYTEPTATAPTVETPQAAPAAPEAS